MKKIIIFLCCSFILTWLVWGISSSYALGATRGSSILVNQIVTIIVLLTMWLPGLCVFITKAFSRKDPIILKPLFKLHLRKHVRFYLTAIFLPVALILMGGALYFLVFPGQFTLNSDILFDAIDRNPVFSLLPIDPKIFIPLVITIQALLTIVLGTFFSTLFALGEELAWRGFLYPELRKRYSGISAAFLSGMIWGIWHAPVIAMGHSYSFGYWGYPWTGFGAMTVYCILFGAFLSWLTERTESVWPAALAHGAMNAGSSIPFLFINNMFEGNRILGPAVTGILSGIPVFILGLWCMFLLRKKPRAENGIWVLPLK